MRRSFERIQLTDEAKADIVKLPPAVRRAVVSVLIEIENNLSYGPPLGAQLSTGDLRGCRKVYVDEPTDDKPKYRLVYWCAPDEHQPRRAVVLAVGPRKDLSVYALAAGRYNTERTRLGLLPVENLSDDELGVQP
ncbi:MAG TPA: hypothetical protein VK662_05940 [Acidothermaceae bacterium]|nr:hypothetical protein [Acidothermaceae bacterium]